MKVDLNSDMGEGFGPWKMGDDDAILDIVTSANVACGWHAGDPNIMFRTAERRRSCARHHARMRLSLRNLRCTLAGYDRGLM